jgi:hypothetical protein
VSALVKLVVVIVADARSAEDPALVFAFLLGFAAVLGPIVAKTRRWLGPERSVRTKNLATGAVVGLACAAAGTLLFGGGMDLGGKLLVGGVTCLGLGWAVASGLNEAFAEGPR